MQHPFYALYLALLLGIAIHGFRNKRIKRPGVFRETIQDKKYMTDKAKKVVDSANALSDAVKEAGGCLMVIAQVPAKDGENDNNK